MRINTQIKNLEAYKKMLQIEEATHEFLQNSGYLKLYLPVLSPALVPESYLEVFETEFKYFSTNSKLYLTPSPELFIKRLLAYGIGDCYSLGKSFRNSENPSEKHSPEFTMLEFYKESAGYMDVADITLRLLQYICEKLYGKKEFTFQGGKINLTKWEKLTVAEAFNIYAGIPINKLFDHEELMHSAKGKGYSVEGFTYEDIFSQIYVQEVEPHLGVNGYPTLIYDYPKEFAALAKLNEDGKTAQRFEFYIGAVELGDCYSELTDPKEQKSRFEEESKRRIIANKIAHPVDYGFIEALENGLPECSGIAIGFERLAMVFADVTSMEDLKLISIR